MHIWPVLIASAFPRLSKEPALDISKVQGVVIPGVTRVLVFSYLQPILGFPVIGQAIAHDQAAITDMADN